jgi:putative ABC transport system permease protein
MRIFDDVRLALRTLWKNPSLTVTALLALAIGIGANTVLFSVVNGVLLKPLNYPDPSRLVELTRHYPSGDSWAITATKIDYWRTHNRSFAAVAASGFLPAPVNFNRGGEPERAEVLQVASEYVDVLGVNPSFGRFFNQREDAPNAGNYAVLTYAFWSQRLGKDPNIIGGSLALGGKSYTVVGIMPRGLKPTPEAEILVPLQLAVNPADRDNDYRCIARLKPGVSLRQAREDMGFVAEQFRRQYGKDLVDTRESVGVFEYKEWLTRGFRPALLVLAIAVALVLLIACANVANLLLARSAARQQEVAIRTALGATSLDIIRQLLVESTLLSLAGAALGLLLASVTLPAVLTYAPADLPSSSGIQLDGGVLAFTVCLSLFTGILFGLFPALQSARLGIANPLRDAGTRSTTNAAGNWVRQSLVVAEVALSLVLLIGAGLLLQTFVKLSAVDPGFDPHNVLTMQMSVNDAHLTGTAAVGQLVDRVTTRLESLNGVTSVGATDFLPLHIGSDLPFQIVGRPVNPDNVPDEFIRWISPYYFSAMRIKILAGRDFNRHDVLSAPRVAIVNEAFVRKYFRKTSALGQKLLIGVGMGPVFAENQPREIVGVVSDTHETGLGSPTDPVIFGSLAQVPDKEMALFMKMIPLNWVIRTTRDPLALVPQIRRETLVASGGIPLAEPRRLEDYVGNSIAQQRFLMTLISVFAGLAVFLGSIGIYGVMSYGVARRTRELGIRSALGAKRADLLGMVVKQGMIMAAIGLAAGLLASVGLTQFLKSMLYGVTPTDPAVLAGVTAMLAVVALTACLIPARRAASIDPVIALREE